MPKSASSEEKKGLPGVTQAALFGLCPRCHGRTLFDAPASIAYRCKACGLEFAQFERGSRASSLITFAVAAVMITVALVADSSFQLPFWLMGSAAVVVTIATTLLALRFFKTMLLMARYERSLEQKDHEQ